MKALLIFFITFSTLAVDCGREIEKLCAKSRSNFGECVKKNVKKLPAQCRNEVEGFSGMAEGLASTCMEDIMKYCPISIEAIEASVETASLKQAECLKKNKKKFSSKCNNLLDKLSKSLGGSIEGGPETKKIR